MILEEEIKQIKIRLAKLEAQNKTITLEGWQGKSGLDISRSGESWTVMEHRQERETGEIKEITHEITQENVKMVWVLIQANLKIGESIQSKKLVESLIISKGWDFDADTLWGKRKQYFNEYYYPLKILDYNKLIVYSSGGKITRLI